MPAVLIPTWNPTQHCLLLPEPERQRCAPEEPPRPLGSLGERRDLATAVSRHVEGWAPAHSAHFRFPSNPDWSPLPLRTSICLAAGYLSSPATLPIVDLVVNKIRLAGEPSLRHR